METHHRVRSSWRDWLQNRRSELNLSQTIEIQWILEEIRYYFVHMEWNFDFLETKYMYVSHSKLAKADDLPTKITPRKLTGVLL